MPGLTRHRGHLRAAEAAGEGGVAGARSSVPGNLRRSKLLGHPTLVSTPLHPPALNTSLLQTAITRRCARRSSPPPPRDFFLFFFF